MKKIILIIAFVPLCFSFLYASSDKAKIQELFNQRQDQVKLKEAIELMEAHLVREKDYELTVLLSRSYYFLAEFAEDNNQRLEVYDKGVKAGEAALQLIPEYTAAFTKMKKEEEAIKMVPKEKIDAVYWTAANLARWAKFTSFTKKISSKARVRYLWDRVTELDPSYFYGGSYRFFGGYFALVPTITGEQDPVKSKENFDKALEIAPEYLDTKVLMAEAYCTHSKIKDKDMFRKLLNDVMLADLNAHPAIYPENMIAQKKAKKLLEEEKSLFEE
jgi:tetratricopeptide (TPR) repeat protein